MGCGQSKAVQAQTPQDVKQADTTTVSNGNPTKEAPKAPVPANIASPPVMPAGPKFVQVSGEVADENSNLLVDIFYPQDMDKRTSVPLILYQHGRGCTSSVYENLFSRWVAMGYAVVAPHNKNSAVIGEPPPWESTSMDESPDGIEIQLALKYMISKASDAASLYKKLDVKNVLLGGHSMGGKSAICAGAQIEPKALLLHSPSCSDEGSEVYNLTKEQIEDRFAGLAADRTPIMLITCDQDVMQEKVESIFHAPKLMKCPRIYMQFSEAACAGVEANITNHYKPPKTVFDEEFMQNGPLGEKFRAHCYFGAGGPHDPSVKWGDVFVKLYLSLKGDVNSPEYKQVWGTGPESISKDPAFTKVLVGLPS